MNLKMDSFSSSVKLFRVDSVDKNPPGSRTRSTVLRNIELVYLLSVFIKLSFPIKQKLKVKKVKIE